MTFQWNDETYGHYNRFVADELKEACVGRLWYTIWLTRPFTPATVRQAVIESGANGVILEGEIPSEWLNPNTGIVEPRPEAVNWADVIFYISDINIPKAVVTNFAPFVHWNGLPWPQKAKPLIDADWKCITENFISESPNSTPQNTDAYARNALGWPKTQPMVELPRLNEYDLAGFENVSHWDAGNI